MLDFIRIENMNKRTFLKRSALAAIALAASPAGGASMSKSEEVPRAIKNPDWINADFELWFRPDGTGLLLKCSNDSPPSTIRYKLDISTGILNRVYPFKKA
jgi:hypothetical protein